MEFDVKYRDEPVGKEYTITFDINSNSAANVAEAVCSQKAAEIGLATDDEIEQCKAAMERSIAPFAASALVPAVAAVEQEPENVPAAKEAAAASV